MSARILIVDDMLPSIKVLAAKLSGEYYDVLTASDGPSALKIVNEQAPDLVLLDVMMPGIDGYEVCEQIKKNPDTRHIPVVMVTALSEVSERVRGLDAGADDFLTKPVSDTTLFARVHSLIRLKQMMDQWRLRRETTEKLGFAGYGNNNFDSPLGGARIVLVDESPIESEKIQAALMKDNDEVIVIDMSADIHSAVAGVDLVIISSNGAGCEAYLHLCSQLRAREETRLMPILLIGDEADLNYLVKALDIGISDYVVRPLDKNELLARVRTLVRRKRYQDRLQMSFLDSLALALVDSLTGIHNRRYLTPHLEAVMKRQAEDGKPVSLLMIDIDNFKLLNDTHGHAVGDKVLCKVADSIARNIRGFDLVARYGGEEFVVVMPDTPIRIAIDVAERLCQTIGSNPVCVDNLDKAMKVTVSIGVAENRDGGGDQEKLIDMADKEMYRAKSKGRNCISYRD